MTEEKYMKDNNVSKRQMVNWKKNNWIRGAHFMEDGTYYIPEGAIKPYARRNTNHKNGVGMYISLIHGISKGLDVFPELYSMHPARFAFFINNLVTNKFIEPITIEGITYYNALPKCLECSQLTYSAAKRFITNSLDTISPIIEAAARGITTKFLSTAC